MGGRPASQTLLKALDISSATAREVPHLLKALAILSDTTVRRSAVDREDLNPYWKSETKKLLLLNLLPVMKELHLLLLYFYRLL